VNTFWLKIAGAAVGVVVVIVLISVFTGGGDQSQPAEPEKGFYDQVEKDKEKFLTAPQPVEPSKQEVTLEPNVPPAEKNIAEPVQPTVPVPEPPKPTTLYFKELSEIDDIEAQRLLNATVPGRSMGRLQIGFKLMVDNCRRIIQKWPDSWYAYKAHLMLADIPPRYQKRYSITEQEMDVSKFSKPRPGTKPFTIKE